MKHSVYYFLDNPSPDWVAIFALIIAIISVGIAVYYSRRTLQLTKEHSKKSVEPILTSLYQHLAPCENNELTKELFQIKNCGFGPAVLRSFIFIRNEKEYSNMYEIYKEIQGGPKTENGYRIHLSDNEVIASNDAIIIFEFNFKKSGQIRQGQVFFELAKEVSLKIEYETIYGDKRTFFKGITV